MWEALSVQTYATCGDGLGKFVKVLLKSPPTLTEDNMNNNNYFIAKGGGSPQARWAEECCKGGDCPVCNPPVPEPCECKFCKGEGWYYVQDGEDDVVKEPCDCKEVDNGC